MVFEELATRRGLGAAAPTTDGWELLRIRRTEPDRDAGLLLVRLNLQPPLQPPPRISPANVS